MDSGKLVAYLGANTREFDTKLNSSIGKVKSFAISAAGIMAGVFTIRAVVGWGKAIEQAYNTQIQSVTKLTVALEGQKSVTQSLVKYAGQLQDKTLYGDEATIQAMSLVAAFTKEEQKIKELLPLIQDLATAKGMDLSSATDIVTKSIFTNMNALSRYIGSMELSSDTNERFIAITKRLNDLYGGQAEAARQANSGMIPLKNTIGDLKELMGKAVVEGTALKRVLDNLNESIKNINANLSKNQAQDFLEDFKKFELTGKEVEEQLRLITEAQGEYNQKMQQYLEFDVMTKGQVKKFSIMADLYKEIAKALGEYAKELRDASDAGTESVGIIDNINKQIETLKSQVGGLTSKGDIKETLTAIYEYEQELKALTDLTPEIETLTKVQSKNALVVVEGLKAVDEGLKTNSGSWASYKSNVWEAIYEIEDFSQVIQSTMVDAIDSISKSIADLITQTDSIEGFFKNLAMMVANFALQIGKLIAAIGAALMFIPGMQGLGGSLLLASAGIMTAGYIGKNLLERTPGASTASAVNPSNSNYGSNYSIGTQNIKVQVVGKIDGRDIALANARGGKMLSDMT